MIYIGIDTGVHTGIAIWDNRKRSLEMVKQMPIHRAMAVVQSYAVRGDIKFDSLEELKAQLEKDRCTVNNLL